MKHYRDPEDLYQEAWHKSWTGRNAHVERHDADARDYLIVDGKRVGWAWAA